MSQAEESIEYLSDDDNVAGVLRGDVFVTLDELMVRARKAATGLRSLGEPWADTTSAAGRMVLTVFAGMAEFERALIHQRTSSGRDAAMKRGVRFGRPAKLTTEQIALGQRLIGEGQSPRHVAKMFKVHPATLYRALSKPAQADRTSAPTA